MNVVITIKNVTSYYHLNVTPEKYLELLDKAEKCFDFSFYSNKNVSTTLEDCQPKRYMYHIPKHVLDKIKAKLPDYSDIALLEVCEDKDGNQDITQHDMAGAMLAMIKAYDNSFEFKSVSPDFISLNTLMNDHKLGDFFYE